MRIVAGVDGCPRGWVAAVWGPRGVDLRVTPLPIVTLRAALADAEVVAIDVPIGYGPDRSCDRAAKARLGAAHSRVFPTPSEAVLRAGSHAEACDVAKARGEKGISVQTWNIRERILDATEHRDGLVEAHPEVSFAALAGDVLPPKRTPAGATARVAALEPVFGDVRALIAGRDPGPRPDDVLDALACAWTARRVLDGTAVYLGDGPVIAY